MPSSRTNVSIPIGAQTYEGGLPVYPRLLDSKGNATVDYIRNYSYIPVVGVDTALGDGQVYTINVVFRPNSVLSSVRAFNSNTTEYPDLFSIDLYEVNNYLEDVSSYDIICSVDCASHNSNISAVALPNYSIYGNTFKVKLNSSVGSPSLPPYGLTLEFGTY
jgi:hypothetical protein